MGIMKRMLGNGKKISGKSGSLPFEISLESISEAEKFDRRQDTDRREQFNQDVRAWSILVTRKLRSSVRAMIKNDRILSNSIRPNLYYDHKYGKEVSRVGFSFVREGIYVHKGAGHGQGGFKGGSTWINARGETKSTLKTSLMKMGTGNRPPKEWFNPVIAGELSSLADLVSEYSATLQIDATNIYID